MTINYRISWYKNEISFLNKYNVKISYEYNIVLVEFDSKTEHYKEILCFAKKHNYRIISNPVFTSDEMDNAEWFAIGVIWTNLYS